MKLLTRMNTGCLIIYCRVYEICIIVQFQTMRVQTIQKKADAVSGSLDRGHKTVLLTWSLSTKRIITIILRNILTFYYQQY